MSRPVEIVSDHPSPSASALRSRTCIAVSVLLIASLCAAPVHAQGADETVDGAVGAVVEEDGRPELDLAFQTGEVQIGRDLATIDLPDDYRYLQSADARRVVEDFWGNPPDPSVLGLIVHRDVDLLSAESWAVIVSYEEEGFVEDDDVDDLDFDEILEGMQEGTREANPIRAQQGYPTIDLVGWAEAPHYDRDAKKLYWAKDLQFGGEDVRTLNYEVRILGRKGFIVFNAVASIDALPVVAAGCKTLLARTEFAEGKRYSDFDPDIDKVAAYGIGGLIAGKVLAKVGFFAKFAAIFAKAGKLIVLAVVGLGAAIAKLFRRKPEEPQA